MELSENVRQRTKLKQTVQKLAARHTPEAVAELISRGKVIEVADERERFEAIAQDYAKNPIRTLVISPANRERSELNWLIHGELQREGNVSSNDHQTTVYVSRSDMTGPERTFAEGKRGAITVLSKYRQQHCRKIVTNEKRQVLQPAASR